MSVLTDKLETVEHTETGSIAGDLAVFEWIREATREIEMLRAEVKSLDSRTLGEDVIR